VKQRRKKMEEKRKKKKRISIKIKIYPLKEVKFLVKSYSKIEHIPVNKKNVSYKY